MNYINRQSINKIDFLQSHNIHGMGEEDRHNRPHQEMGQLTFEEKKFLLAVERGDVASTRRSV